MKILVLGAGGMLGHKMAMLLKNDHQVITTTREPFEKYKKFQIFDERNHLDGLDVTDESALRDAVYNITPDVILNCIGVTTRKLRPEQSDLVIRINSLLPHTLANLCRPIGARLIHFSTDCVFSGKKGGYTEEDTTDARDLYGLSKILGEVSHPHCLTIRSSIIGREIFHHTELVEWLVSQAGKSIKGFSRVFYSGVTTNTMARVVRKIIKHHHDLTGIYQLASPSISKFDLLSKINLALGLGVRIENDPSHESNKTLNGSSLEKILKISDELEWDHMIKGLADEHKLYEGWK